jgi:hypothetical protein
MRIAEWVRGAGVRGVKHYDLESALKAGHRGTTNHIVEWMQDFDKVVWIQGRS